MKKKAFTLIELIAVLVILAILALIVTPLVMNIIKKARISADKRSIDAYGRSVELAIANYLLDNGSFPTDISQLSIEYSGDRVECSTAQLNNDSSVYLAGCTVEGRSIDYTYGKGEAGSTYTAYSVGDEVTYNNVAYRVIKDSGAKDSSVTLLKAEPITSSEIIPYISSTEVAGKVDTSGIYLKTGYYSNENCKSAGGITGCSTDYNVSDVKQLVDVWKTNKAPSATEARLITYDELIDNLGCTSSSCSNSSYSSWIYNSDYWYWTNSQYQESELEVWYVGQFNSLSNIKVYTLDYYGGVVRPVITISKSALEN